MTDGPSMASDARSDLWRRSGCGHRGARINLLSTPPADGPQLPRGAAGTIPPLLPHLARGRGEAFAIDNDSVNVIYAPLSPRQMIRRKK